MDSYDRTEKEDREVKEEEIAHELLSCLEFHNSYSVISSIAQIRVSMNRLVWAGSSVYDWTILMQPDRHQGRTGHAEPYV